MSLTNPAVQVPVHDTVGSWLRRHLGWMLIGLAVAAAAVLVTVLVLDGSSASTTTVREPSLSATDHRISAEARMELERSRTGRESITAIDHRAASVPQESITAIDHRAGG